MYGELGAEIDRAGPEAAAISRPAAAGLALLSMHFAVSASPGGYK